MGRGSYVSLLFVCLNIAVVISLIRTMGMMNAREFFDEPNALLSDGRIQIQFSQFSQTLFQAQQPKRTSMTTYLAKELEQALQSVLPFNVFETADVFFNYNFVEWANEGADFTKRVSDALYEGGREKQIREDIEWSNKMSAINAVLKQLATVNPLPGATRDVPVQTSWLGGFLLYFPNDFYNVMENQGQWFTTFNDCSDLSSRLASQAPWRGSFVDPSGRSRSWNCYSCKGTMATVGHQCGFLSDAGTQ